MMEISEEDRIKAVIMQPLLSSGKIPEPKPGPNYTCHRCNERGHFIKYCPTNGNPNFDQTSKKSKRPSGIPTTFLQAVSKATDKEPETMLESSSGQRFIRLEDHADFTNSLRKTVKKIPAELACAYCHNAPRMAVITRCCNYSYCYDCASQLLISSQYHCPLCKTPGQTIHSLIPNNRLREIIFAVQNNNFKSVDTKS
jgi:hypothetical protein